MKAADYRAKVHLLAVSGAMVDQLISDLAAFEVREAALVARVEEAEEDSLLMQGCNDLVIRDRAEDQAKLAAAEAREAKLREALEVLAKEMDLTYPAEADSVRYYAHRLLCALAAVKEEK